LATRPVSGTESAPLGEVCAFCSIDSGDIPRKCAFGHIADFTVAITHHNESQVFVDYLLIHGG
jgi:hypothetical protein